MNPILTACAAEPVAEFAPGEALIREGEPGGRLLVLIEGTVTVSKNDVEVAVVREPGAIFGEMSVLLGLPASATLRAAAPTRAHDVHDGAGFLRTGQDVALETARLLAHRLHHATTYLADVKIQFQDHADHLGMLDRVLETLMAQHMTGQADEGEPHDPQAPLGI